MYDRKQFPLLLIASENYGQEITTEEINVKNFDCYWFLVIILAKKTNNWRNHGNKKNTNPINIRDILYEFLAKITAKKIRHGWPLISIILSSGMWTGGQVATCPPRGSTLRKVI